MTTVRFLIPRWRGLSRCLPGGWPDLCLPSADGSAAKATCDGKRIQEFNVKLCARRLALSALWPKGYLVGRMQRWRRPLKQQLSAAATCGCSLPPLLSRRSGSGLFMASAHVQTIPGELLKQTALAGQPQLLPELSNFYCYPSRAGGSPWVISVAHHPYSCAARVEARPRRVGGRTARFWKDVEDDFSRVFV